MNALPPSLRSSPASLLLIFLRLGLTSFGGPVAHIGYFRAEFVQRRAWLDDREFADLLALCQFLPGPASSQMGMAIGALRAGPAGAAAAWLGFTLPSALLMYAFAVGLNFLASPLMTAILHGLQLVAVAIVAQAIASMARRFCTDALRAALALLGAACMLAWQGPAAQATLLAVAAVAGAALLTPRAPPPAATISRVSPTVARVLLVSYFGLLLASVLLSGAQSSPGVSLAASLYRSGALVFGGGHVVLPMLQAQAAAHGWMSDQLLLAGYSAAQALPGPLFSFAAFIGAGARSGLGPASGALLGTLAIFLPSYLLVLGVAPLWNRLRAAPLAQAMFAAVNAAVVGLLLAAWYRPIITTAIHQPRDVLVAGIALLALLQRAPPWSVVAGGALCGWLMMPV